MAATTQAIWLALRNLAMIVLFPGTVTLYIPYRLLDPFTIPGFTAWSLNHVAASLVMVAGALILFRSIWDFAYTGRGTLAPFDETRVLIVVGLHRYVRNPMYIGVILILMGEAWFFQSSTLLSYAGICFVVANLLVMGYEENRLRYKFGEEYRHYCRQVGRWVPGKSYQAQNVSDNVK